MSIKKLFHPIHRFFKLDFEGRITKELEISVYEAKDKYIQAFQQKQYWDSQLEYHKLRLNTLTEMLSTQKGDKNVKTVDSITNIKPGTSISVLGHTNAS